MFTSESFIKISALVMEYFANNKKNTPDVLLTDTQAVTGSPTVHGGSNDVK